MPPQAPPQQKEQSQGSQKLYIDLSGRGGLAPRWQGDESDTIAQYPQFRYIGDQDQNPGYAWRSTASQYAAGVFSPTRRYGFMCPAPNSYTTVTASSGSFSNEWVSTHYDSQMQTAFFGENSSQLWVTSNIGSDATTLKLGVGGAITNATRITDIETYQVNGVRKVFYAYQKASAGDIGICTQTNGADTSHNNTWFTGTAALSGISALGSGNDFFFVSADNGYMYMGDGNLVHKIDGTAATGGTNGTVTGSVLVAPPNFTFLDGVDFKGSVWFAILDNPTSTNDTSSFAGGIAGVYVWDRNSTIVNMVDFIPIKGIKHIRKIFVTQNGKVRIICLSSKRTTQIREFDGSVFQLVDEEHYVSYPTYRDSFTIAGNLINWMGGDGRLYAYGDVVPGEQEQLYMLGDFTDIPTGSFTAGAVLFFDVNYSATVARTAVMFSLKDASPAVSNRAWYPNAAGATPHAGNVFTLVKHFPGPVKVNYARIYHNAGNTSGTTQQGTLSIFLNQATTANKTFAVTRNDIAKGYKYCPLNQALKSVVVSIQAEIQWSAVTTADATDWMPRVLEIDYEPLTRLL